MSLTFHHWFALLTFVCLTIESFGTSYARRFESSAEVLKFDGDRLYLWLDSSGVVNTDFVFEFPVSDKKLVRVDISDCFGRVAVTDRLDSEIAALADRRQPQWGTIFLPQERITDSLKIGRPRSLGEQMQLLTDPSNKQDTTNRLYSFPLTISYSTLTEVEIDLQVGRVDVFLLPEIECDGGRFKPDCCHISRDFVEWYLLVNQPDKSLIPTALSYCLKMSAADPHIDFSTLFRKEDIERRFPQNLPHAKSLFSQVKSLTPRLTYYIPDAACFPAFAEWLVASTRRCGAELSAWQPKERDTPDLVILPLFRSSTLPDTVWAKRHLDYLFEIADSLAPLVRDDFPPECSESPVPSASCYAMFSRRTSESCRVIPLGTMPLCIITAEGVNRVKDYTGYSDLRQFYRSRRQ